MCDYYAFACRFRCLPETHHFPPNRISYIVAYIWLITNDGIPSRYEHRVNYSKKFICISILPPVMILEKKIPSRKNAPKIYPAPPCLSFLWDVKSEYFYCWTHQIHITANTPPALPVWSCLRNAIKLRHRGPSAHLLHNVGCIGRSGTGVNVIFIRLTKPPQIQGGTGGHKAGARSWIWEYCSVLFWGTMHQIPFPHSSRWTSWHRLHIIHFWQPKHSDMRQASNDGNYLPHSI